MYQVDDLLNDERKADNKRVLLDSNWSFQIAVSAGVKQLVQ